MFHIVNLLPTHAAAFTTTTVSVSSRWYTGTFCTSPPIDITTPCTLNDHHHHHRRGPCQQHHCKYKYKVDKYSIPRLQSSSWTSLSLLPPVVDTIIISYPKTQQYHQRSYRSYRHSLRNRDIIKSMTTTTMSKTTTTSLRSSADDVSGLEPTDNDDDNTKQSIKHNNNNKQRLITMYTNWYYLSFVISVLFLLVPTIGTTSVSAISSSCCTNNIGTTTKKITTATGYAIAAMVSYILATATKHDRLTSDTYKRLNIGLFTFCCLGLFSIPSEVILFFVPTKTILPGLFLLMTLLASFKLYGSITMLIGWLQGIRTDTASTNTTINKIITELGHGFLQTIYSLKVKVAKKALTYRNCLLLVLGAIVSNLMQGIYYFRYRNIALPPLLATTSTTTTTSTSLLTQRILTNIPSYTWYDISYQFSIIGRLFLLSTIILSLKDAAERNRLNGTTFIQLNFIVSLWAITIAISQFLLSSTNNISIATTATITTSLSSVTSYSFYRGIQMMVFSFPFILRAIKSLLEKHRKEKVNKI